jgi:RsiW-degrading membrane proteinase PrsW (M82 family)
LSIGDVIPGIARLRGAKMIAGAAALYFVLRLIGFHKFFENDGEGIGALLQIIGTLYSVVYAFAIYVIWGQFTSVESEIQKESGALKDLVLFSRPLKETMREPLVRTVKIYARGVAETEWRALSARESTDKTDKLFAAVISGVTDMKTEDDTERIVCQQLLDIANQASAHRDERLAISSKRMPRTLLLFVTLTACMILFLLFFFPFHNIALGVVAIAITTMLLFFAHFVLTDLDNPFEGTWNVGAEPFAELVTKLR